MIVLSIILIYMTHITRCPGITSVRQQLALMVGHSQLRRSFSSLIRRKSEVFPQSVLP